MTTERGACVVFGSGPGIGVNVAKIFAEKAFKLIVLLSRNEKRLEEDASQVKAAAPGVSVATISVDLSQKTSLDRALEEVTQHLGSTKLEFVLYNAARVGVSKMLEWPVEDFESDLRISVTSLYAVSQWAIPQFLENKQSKPEGYRPALFVTSGGLYRDAFPALFSLAACKAAQYNLTHSLHKEYGRQGIHCALIVVEGRVNDDAKVTTARHIAEKTLELYEQDQMRGWDLDVVITDPDYKESIRRRGEQV